ncbi:hypothetical protein D3C86_1922360 [compost metagenome]
MASELSFLKAIWAMGSMTMPRRTLMGEFLRERQQFKGCRGEHVTSGWRWGSGWSRKKPCPSAAYSLHGESVLKRPDDWVAPVVGKASGALIEREK